jgi:hypothetical protein
VLLSEAITRGMARAKQDAPQVTEDMLAFTCERCGRGLSATQTVVTRKPGEVMYACPDDAAALVTIHANDYAFHEGDVTISVGGDRIAWWEFVNSDDPGPGTQPHSGD